MPVIMNCLDEDNETRVGGNTFKFKARQLKFFSNPDIASVIDRLKKEDGFISLPSELEYLAHLGEEMAALAITPEHKALIEEKRREGINTYCQNLRRLIFNATVSLQKDIDKSGAKYDSRTEATRGDIKRLQQLAKYQEAHLDKDQEKVDLFKELEQKISSKG